MTDDPTLRIDEDAVLGLVTAIVDLEYLGRRRDCEIHAPGRMLETVQSHLQSTRAKDLRVELAITTGYSSERPRQTVPALVAVY